MFAILKKEFKSYFLSPIGYVFISLFLAMFSILFYITTIRNGATTFQYVFYYSAMYTVVFIIPILTMRTFSEERKNGTEQLLLTSPRSSIAITLGKFFAAALVVIIAEVCTLVYFGILCYFKVPDISAVAISMLGFLLLSMAYISFGMFVSSLTENQIIAAIVTIGVFILTWLSPNVSTAFTKVCLMEQFYPFITGKLPIAETINLILISVMFIVMTMIVIKRRKLLK